MYLSDKQLAIRWGISRPTVWRWAKTDPTFPPPIKLSPQCTRWNLSEIEAWEKTKADAERAKTRSYCLEREAV